MKSHNSGVGRNSVCIRQVTVEARIKQASQTNNKGLICIAVLRPIRGVS